MSRQNVIFVVLCGLAIAAFPVAQAGAQSGDALAHAESTCMAYGVGPDSAGFETCVDRAALAFDRGEPDAAYRQAAIVRDAHDLCRSYGIAPATLGFKQCVGSEIEKRSVATYTIRYAQPYGERPHAAIVIDDYGFTYDRDGNLLDRNGYVIRYVP